jgi:hypothetical protein
MAAMNNMTSDELRAAIVHLFGAHGGQRKLANMIGANDSSIRRYLMGTRRVPTWLVFVIAHLYERKRSGLPLDIPVESVIAELLAETE